MDGPSHYRKAEELAAKAAEYLGHGDGQDAAAVWAAVAQVHALLAIAEAVRMNAGSTDNQIQAIRAMAEAAAQEGHTKILHEGPPPSQP